MKNRIYTRPGSQTYKRVTSLIVSTTFAGLILSACAEPDQAAAPEQLNSISIENAWSPEFAGGDTRAVYLTIVNSGDIDDRVIAVQSDATTTTLHQSNHQHGIIRMQDMPTGLAVPAQSQVQLAPGGTHVMMSGLERSFEVGDTFQLEFEFEQSGELTAEVEIKTLIPE